MARKYVNPDQLSFDFAFDTEEENQVAKHSQIVEMVIDELTAAPVAEVEEIVVMFIGTVLIWWLNWWL